ncbi:S8 family peptidase [Hoeflea sp.]|uniref:S8 family peptidase n=1 Tax=Hoeflea sp. TaxID=1940281 RepID=UPI003B51A316
MAFKTASIAFTLSLVTVSANADDLYSRFAAAFETPEYFAGNGLGQIQASAAYGAGFTGDGTLIAIIDDGFQLDHPDLVNKFIEQSHTAIGGGTVPLNFHGTHVAGIAAGELNGLGNHGVAFDADLAFYTYGIGANPLPGHVAAFATAAVQSPAVISNSWGTDINVNAILNDPAFGTDPFAALANATGQGTATDWNNFTDTMEQAQQDSVILFAASNNPAFTDIDISAGLPLAIPDLSGAWIAVVNADSNDALVSAPCGSAASFCMAGPGTNILSAFPGGIFLPLTGTSMATPHVAGAVAIARQMYPDAAPEDLAQLILQTSRDIGAPGIDYQFGWGMLNLANLAATVNPQTGDLFPASAWAHSEALRHFGDILRQRLIGSGGSAVPSFQPLGYAPGSFLPPAADNAAPRHAWGSAIGGLSNLSAGAASSAYRGETAGLAFGLDTELDNGLRIGVATGYTHQSLDAKSGANSGRSDGFHLGAYGAMRRGGWQFEAEAQLAYFSQSLTRRAIGGATGTAAAPVGVSNPKTLAGEGSLRAGPVFAVDGGTVMPFGAITVRSQETGAFTETGAGIFSLSVPKSSLFQAEIGPGLRAERMLAMTDRFILTGSADASYSYLMGDRTATVQTALLGRPIAASTATPGRHIASIGGRLAMSNFDKSRSASLSYRGRFQKNASSHSGSLTLRIAF